MESNYRIALPRALLQTGLITGEEFDVLVD